MKSQLTVGLIRLSFLPLFLVLQIIVTTFFNHHTLTPIVPSFTPFFLPAFRISISSFLYTRYRLSYCLPNYKPFSPTHLWNQCIAHSFHLTDVLPFVTWTLVVCYNFPLYASSRYLEYGGFAYEFVCHLVVSNLVPALSTSLWRPRRKMVIGTFRF